MIKLAQHAKRFRGLWPVVIDVETSGLDPERHALLEIAAVFLEMDGDGQFHKGAAHSYHVEASAGLELDDNALAVTGIKPHCGLRYAIPERQALERLFHHIRADLAEKACYRALLVGHNAWFDLNFVLASCKRANLAGIPFHRFTAMDTASLSAVMLGETVLARALRRVSIPFSMDAAHAAWYDADRTAELFCTLINRSRRSSG